MVKIHLEFTLLNTFYYLQRICHIILTIQLPKVYATYAKYSKNAIIILKSLYAVHHLFINQIEDLPVHEGALGIHEIELVIKTSPGLGDGGRVAQHAHGALHLGQVTAGNDGWWLVVDADLKLYEISIMLNKDVKLKYLASSYLDDMLRDISQSIETYF